MLVERVLVHTPSLTHSSNAHICHLSLCPKVFQALWSDPKPFIQLLGHLLSLPTFWIPTCWPVQLEFYQWLSHKSPEQSELPQ